MSISTVFTSIAPFPIVRPVTLSDFQKQKITAILDDISIEHILTGINTGKWDLLIKRIQELAVLSSNENSVTFSIVSPDEYATVYTTNLAGFITTEALQLFKDETEWFGIINIGHPVKILDGLMGESVPSISISATVFTDGHGRRCNAELIFIPRLLKPLQILQIPNEVDILNEELDLYFDEGKDGFQTFAEMEQIEVFTNAMTKQNFVYLTWRGNPLLQNGGFEDEHYSAIINLDEIVGKGNYSVVEK